MKILRAGIILTICLFLFFSFSPLTKAGTFYSCDNQTAPEMYCYNIGCNGFQETKPPVASCQCTGCNKACENDCGTALYAWSDTDGCTCLSSLPDSSSSCKSDSDCIGPCPGLHEVYTCVNGQCQCLPRANCPAPPATDTVSCNNYCRCEGKPSGIWNDKTKICTCDSTDPTDPSTGGSVTINPPYGASGPQNIGDLIKNITNWVLGLAGAVAVLFIIIAGFRYIIAHGDSKQTEAAKSALRNAIIGLVFVILSFFIVRFIVNVLTGQV